MKRIFVNILLLFVSLNLAFAQTANVDSVVSRIVTTLNVDTVTPRKYTQIANSLAGNGYYSEALLLIGKVVEMDPKYYLSKAVIAFNAGLMDRAIADINKYITCQKKDFNGYYFRGWCYDNLRKYDEAIKNYSQAIKLNSSYPYAYLGRANMYRAINEWHKARKDYQKVISLEPVPNTNSCMQYAYLFLGQKNKAKRIMDAMLTIYDTPGNNYDAACLYSDMNEKDSALYYLERALAKGYKKIAHIMQDDDLDYIRGDKRYAVMMQKYSQKHDKTPEEIISAILGKADTMEDKYDKNEYNDTTVLGKLFASVDTYKKEKTINNLLSQKSAYDKSHKNQILQGLSTDYMSSGYYVDAIKYKSIYLKMRKSLYGRDKVYAANLSTMANYYTYMGDYYHAIKCGKEVLRLNKKFFGKHHVKYVASLERLASYYVIISDFKKALELNKEALAIRESISNDGDYQAYGLSAVAYDYYLLDDYQSAIKYETQSLKLRARNKTKWSSSYSSSVSNMALFYSSLGNYKKAALWERLSSNVKPQIFKNDKSQYSHNMAYYCSMLGDYRKAKELEILNLRKNANKNTNVYPNLLNHLSYYCFKLGERQRAVELCQLAKDIIETNRNKNMSIYTRILNNLAYYDFSLGKYKEGLALEEENKDQIKNIWGNKGHQYINVLLKLASYHHQVGNDKKSCSYALDFSAIIRQYVRDNFLWLTSDERKTFWNMYNHALSDMVPRLTYQLQSDSLYGACYDAAILYKGILLNTQTEFKKIVMDSGNQQLINDYGKLEKNKAALTHLYDTSASSLPLDIDSIETVCTEEERAIMEKSALYGDFTKTMTYRWRDVQQVLKANDTAIEFLNFHCGGDSVMYAALVLNKHTDCPKMIPLALKRDFDRYAANMYSGDTCRQMYNLVWKQLEPYMSDAGDVYFSPSGMFYQTNIEAFRDSSGRMASEKYHLYRVSSTREICYGRNEKRPQTAALYGNIDYFMGTEEMAAAARRYHTSGEENVAMRGLAVDSTDTRGPLKPLEGTEKEVENIADELNKGHIHVALVTGKDGTEESFKDLSGKHTGIIHLATHGFFFNDQKAKDNTFINRLMMNDDRLAVDMSMKRAGLAFAGANNAWSGNQLPAHTDDGILLAEEIPDIDLRGCDLLVLSACETGLGDVTSEGVFGLQRGFKQAGVKTIVMSLWNVKDVASQKFMSQFYHNLMSGQTKRQAFIDAQKSLRDSSEFGDPKDWAAFIMLDGI
jgi:tetratricopeptide (TPR) repeat protein